MSSSTALARVVLGVLVLSTVGAFFVTQRLKRSTPPVKRIVVPHYVAPESDGPYRIARIHFALPKADDVTVSVVNANGDEVRRLLDDKPLGRGTHYFFWSGRDGLHRLLADGTYSVRIVLHGQGRAVTSPRSMQLVTKPPPVRLVSVSPGHERPGERAPVTIRFVGPIDQPARFTVYRTDSGPPRAVATFQAYSNSVSWQPDRPLAAGLYAFSVTVESRAGIEATWPAAAATALPHTGLDVTGPTLSGPLTPVAAGTTALLSLHGVHARVPYALTRLGERRPLSRGTATAPDVRVPIPERAASGIYTVRAGGASFPVTVQGARHHPLLAVVPALTWQALNPLDEDGSGFGETLRNRASVDLGRPFAAGRLPRDLGREVAPLAELLDARHIAYDATTDLALAQDPALSARRAVVFLGSEPWITRSLADALYSYVAGGGRAALFGAGDFTGAVAISGGRALTRGPLPSRPFGERTAPASSEAAPLVVASDDVGLFGQTSGYVGLFTRFEQSQSLPPGARVLAAAGREPGHPAFVVYTLGHGLVARTGTPQWSAALASDAQVADVTERLWALLSR